MPRGKHPSPLSRSERIERASELFAQGFTNADVARRLRISKDTATSYRRIYETNLQKEAAENPRQLTDVLGNTVRMVHEIDQVRREAWKRLHRRSGHRCDECMCHIPMPTNEANALLKTILDTANQRARIFGLLGVKQEYFAQVAKMQSLVSKLLTFMQSELCEEDRARLVAFLETETGATGDVFSSTPYPAQSFDLAELDTAS